MKGLFEDLRAKGWTTEQCEQIIHVLSNSQYLKELKERNKILENALDLCFETLKEALRDKRNYRRSV